MHPLVLRYPQILRNSAFPLTIIKAKVDVSVGITVSCLPMKTANAHFDSKFLPNLSLQSLPGILAVLNFTAGKLPETRHMPARRTLTDENASLIPDNPGDDAEF